MDLKHFIQSPTLHLLQAERPIVLQKWSASFFVNRDDVVCDLIVKFLSTLRFGLTEGPVRFLFSPYSVQ